MFSFFFEMVCGLIVFGIGQGVCFQSYGSSFCLILWCLDTVLFPFSLFLIL